MRKILLLFAFFLFFPATLFAQIEVSSFSYLKELYNGGGVYNIKRNTLMTFMNNSSLFGGVVHAENNSNILLDGTGN